MPGWMRRAAPTLVILLMGCAVQEEAPVPPRPDRPRVVTPEPVRPVEGAWSFSVANGVCTASVSHPGAAVTIAVGPAQMMRVTARVSSPGATGAARSIASGLAFMGRAGGWNSRLRRDGQAAMAEAPLDDAAETRLRALLGGGSLRLTRGNASLALLTVPDAGVAGREWFGCVSQLRA